MIVFISNSFIMKEYVDIFILRNSAYSETVKDMIQDCFSKIEYTIENCKRIDQ